MPTLDGYVRVSRVGGRDGDGFISPDVQEKAIRQWAEQHGHEIVMQRHELNVSGGTMDRPVFNKIMDRIRTRKTGGVVVFKLDRFARNLLGAVETLAEIGQHDAVFASATEPMLDYSTPSGRAFVQQMFVFAEFMRETVKESWATSQREAIGRGIHITPHVPFGYDKIDRRLVPNENAPHVVTAFLMRGDGASWGSIAEHLNLVSPRESGMWTGKMVADLCKKRVYVGEASRFVEQDIDGRGAVVTPNAHPALVTEEQWHAAQRAPRHALGGKKAGEPASTLLSGLIRCAGCRFSMSTGTGPKGERTYRCRGKHSSGKCTCSAIILRDTIDTYVEGLVLAEIDGLARIVPDTSERDVAADALTTARVDLEEFRRDREARRKLGHDWHDWLDDYLRAVRDAEATLDAIDARTGAAMEGLTREHYLALPIHERREVLGGFIDAVIVRKSVGRGRNVDAVADRTRILWRGQAPADLPRQRVKTEVRPFSFEEHDIEAGMAAA